MNGTRKDVDKLKKDLWQAKKGQAAGRMSKRKVIAQDYVRCRALWLPPEARYDSIMEQAAARTADLPALVTPAMHIEPGFESLKGVLPSGELV